MPRVLKNNFKTFALKKRSPESIYLLDSYCKSALGWEWGEALPPWAPVSEKSHVGPIPRDPLGAETILRKLRGLFGWGDSLEGKRGGAGRQHL